MEKSNREDLASYYQILQIPSDATSIDIRQAYLRLIKLSHPDKNRPCGNVNADSSAQTVIEAYSVLVDPSRRKAYDTQLELKPVTTDHRVQCEREPQQPIVSQIIDLSEFTQLSPIAQNSDDRERIDKFIYPCRCGGQFMITSQDMDLENDIVGCNGCSLTVKVEFKFDYGDE
ncbi:hypothetical protein CROQUDRAFT_653923 [Cronartium quercuum f. sp. fusiforme G11]|uniref:Diphthamide biosynthesis protein 4 n=1 Tax=Cronartium quercuum f. sp. fusiforme G11 TaxID=708437 RepID=A0A9P6NN80_9BASI|nr:hypothetical protein CROQUDRAFT_653923 [Cronartium quercuum f. sp. fusiforme G11]